MIEAEIILINTWIISSNTSKNIRFQESFKSEQRHCFPRYCPQKQAKTLFTQIMSSKARVCQIMSSEASRDIAFRGSKTSKHIVSKNVQICDLIAKIISPSNLLEKRFSKEDYTNYRHLCSKLSWS